MAYMDCMDHDVLCPKKADKLNLSLLFSLPCLDDIGDDLSVACALLKLNISLWWLSKNIVVDEIIAMLYANAICNYHYKYRSLWTNLSEMASSTPAIHLGMGVTAVGSGSMQYLVLPWLDVNMAYVMGNITPASMAETSILVGELPWSNSNVSWLLTTRGSFC